MQRFSVTPSNGDGARYGQELTHGPHVAMLSLRKPAPADELGKAHLGRICISSRIIIIKCKKSA